MATLIASTSVLRWERPIYALEYQGDRRDEERAGRRPGNLPPGLWALPGFKGQAQVLILALQNCAESLPGLDPAEKAHADRRHARGVDVTSSLPSRDRSNRSRSGRAAGDEPHPLPRAEAAARRATHRDCVKEYHGLTFQEIADLQGCPLSTVKTRLYQALTVLRRHLESQGMTSYEKSE